MNRLYEMPATRLRNFMLLLGYTIITIVLAVAYGMELVNGNRTEQYVFTYICVLLTMLIGSYVTFLFLQDTDTKFAYIVLMLYCVFHLYTMITSLYAITFTYIFPMLLLLIMYNNKRLSTVVTMSSTINVVIACITRYYIGSYVNWTEVEISIACMILVSIFIQLGQIPIIQNLNRMEGLEKELLVDTLTKCWNRKFLDNLIEHGFFKSKDVSVILGDINNFKSVNDTLGHTQGDVVLICVGKQLKRICDKYSDTWEIRIGGDEFIVVTKNKDVNALMLELYTSCNEDEMIRSMDIDVKVAFGKCSNVSGRLSYYEMYELADKEMYDRKEEMKNG